MFKCVVLASFFAMLTLDTPNPLAIPPASTLAAADIVNKNVVARGGLQAWRGIKTMTMQGQLGIGGNQRAMLPTALPGKKSEQLSTDPRPATEMQVPFVMKMQRPLKSRFEMNFGGQTAVQVFDGTNGWKSRPYLNRNEIEPFTPEELKIAGMAAPLDGLLVDYLVKGTKVELNGTEKVEDRSCYKLQLTQKNGQVTHIWIDAQTFLEAKLEGQPRKLDGVLHPVEIYYRDYHAVDGLKVPFLLETKVLEAGSSRVKQLPIPTEKIVIEKVMLNSPLDSSLFAKPEKQSTKASL